MIIEDHWQRPRARAACSAGPWLSLGTGNPSQPRAAPARYSPLEDLDRRVPPAEHVLRRDAEPLVEHRCIHPAEIGVELQVAELQLGQARVRADQPHLDLAAD